MTEQPQRPGGPQSVWDAPWFLIPALIFLALALALAYFVPYGDEILALNPLRREPLNSIFRFATHLGEVYSYCVAGIVLIALRRYRFAALIAAIGLLMMPLSYYLKDVIGTMRPLTWFTDGGRWLEVVTVPGVQLASGYTSFPSGHTMSAFALFGALALMLHERHRRWGMVFALIAISVGISRIFLVQHYLADVLAGATLGLLVGTLVWQIARTFHLIVIEEETI